MVWIAECQVADHTWQRCKALELRLEDWTSTPSHGLGFEVWLKGTLKSRLWKRIGILIPSPWCCISSYIKPIPLVKLRHLRFKASAPGRREYFQEKKKGQESRQSFPKGSGSGGMNVGTTVGDCDKDHMLGFCPDGPWQPPSAGGCPAW